jgi:CRP-like cAMP-binding protein
MQLIEIIEVLKKFPLSKCLTEDEIIFLIKSGEIRKFEKHDFIYKTGDESNEIYFLLKGVTKINIHSEGKEMIKMILHPQTILSEQSISGEEIRVNNAVVLSPEAQVLAVKVETIKYLMSKNAALAMCIINFIGKKLKTTEERLESLILHDARERIVEFLKENAETFGKPIGYELLLKHNFTQQDIANYTGTSRQTVTTVLNDLKKRNKIHFKRKSILIRDIATLV